MGETDGIGGYDAKEDALALVGVVGQLPGSAGAVHDVQGPDGSVDQGCEQRAGDDA